MSSAAKTKSKGKKACKEISKSSSKPLGHVSNNGVIPTSGYNPLLGTFHTFETMPVPSASPVHVNGQFRPVDDTDDHNGSSLGTGVEYDSVSNNGSWSGESEDHKEKTSQPLPRQETVPGAENDKREKIRQKNEKKHQRQKERRAQELHERCSGYLMSRKLEALAQQLVSMGFSQERATMSLILNEGRVEESVAWLFEGAEDEKHKEHNLDGGGSLKIDISEEFARITDMEIKFKASKQEVERVVVSCEGNLDLAEETLKAQRQESPPSPPKPEETGNSPVANDKLPMNCQSSVRIQLGPTAYASIQQKRDEKDFNYTKIPVLAMSSLDSGSKNLHISNKIPSKMEWPKPQHIIVPPEKKWPVPASNPTVPYSISSSLQVSSAPVKTEAHNVSVGNELKNLQLGSVREPVIVMQRRQSINPKQAPTSSISSSPSGTAMSWYPNTAETVKPTGLVPPVSVTGTRSPSGIGTNPSFNELHYQTHKHLVSGNGSMDSQGTTRGIGIWSRAGTMPTIAAASSLGLFSGPSNYGSSGSLSPVDWKTGSSTMQFDYSNIDWSLDRGQLPLRPPNRLWAPQNYSIQNSSGAYDSVSYGLDVNSIRRPVLSNMSGGSVPGLKYRATSSEPSAGGSREWTSPFEEKDIVILPRHTVHSPSL